MLLLLLLLFAVFKISYQLMAASVTGMIADKAILIMTMAAAAAVVVLEIIVDVDAS
jgi:hypothetical protein